MAEVTKALIYQALVELQGEMASVAESMGNCVRETRAIQAQPARTSEIVRDIHFVLARNDGHLTRIEGSLGIVEAG
jgi:hypothetical protein